MSKHKSERTPRSPLPSPVRFVWMLFMQPYELQRVLDGHLSPDDWRWFLLAIFERDWRRVPANRRFVGALLLVPLTVLAIDGICNWVGWRFHAMGAASGYVQALLFSRIAWPGNNKSRAALLSKLPKYERVIHSAVVETTLWQVGSMVWTITSILAASLVGGFLDFGVDTLGTAIVAGAVGVVAGLYSSTVLGFFFGRTFGTISLLAIIAGFFAVKGSVTSGSPGAGLATFAWVSLFVSPFIGGAGYPLAVLVMLVIRLIQRLDIKRGPDLCPWLPHRWSDMIYLPLPGLGGFIVDLARVDSDDAAQVLQETARSQGQRRVSRTGLLELQARTLERAAREADWHRAQSFALPFLPPLTDLEPTDPLRRYADAAGNLAAASLGGDQRRQRNLIDQAEAQIKGQGISLISTAPKKNDRRTSRLLQVNRVWLDAIAKLRARLESEVAANPEIPKVYITGPALDPRDPDAVRIFRGRRDLMEVIDHDLADDRRAALFLIGQRRMGKTSLLRMLPPHLGNRTVLVTLDFQGLSGSGHGAHPHRWVAEATRGAIADAIPRMTVPALPESDAWGQTLAWLEAIEARLEAHNRRVLIAIDEVERVQTGIDEGWSTPVFLDFVRAAGDRLRHIRLLLVSAHPPARLGATWADRLISAVTRDLGPLPMDDAEGLLRLPVPDFPAEVFDDTAAQAVLEQTGGHPFLIQLVGDAVVARLNGDKRRAATAKDIRRALDVALNRAGQSLFPDLWRVLDGEQQALLRALAEGQQPGIDSRAFRSLRDLHYLREGADGAAYVFPLFGRWVRDHAA